MNDDYAKQDQAILERKPLPAELVFDPFREHFVSQNRRNDFLKSLEQRTADDWE
ncbi:hypothetical protein [Zhengella mangrovi]|uniref:hypothetical protein n=1 Tax=Zhengella mangrovi TaxID=1982044 RepID=UPI0013FD82B8|nr:hypothetical protein [Zhengella mangrovi]